MTSAVKLGRIAGFDHNLVIGSKRAIPLRQDESHFIASPQVARTEMQLVAAQQSGIPAARGKKVLQH
jgi:hypothetical protein